MRYSPVRHSSTTSKLVSLPFDLHVLGLPPAFNLSHDQTLQLRVPGKPGDILCSDNRKTAK